MTAATHILTIIEANAFLSTVRYKAHHTLKWKWWKAVDFASDHPSDILALVMWWEFARPDRDDSEGELMMGEESSRRIVFQDGQFTEETLARHILGMTLALEEHEAREFLTFDGVRVFNPHVELVDEARRRAGEARFDAMAQAELLEAHLRAGDLKKQYDRGVEAARRSTYVMAHRDPDPRDMPQPEDALTVLPCGHRLGDFCNCDMVSGE